MIPTDVYIIDAVFIILLGTHFYMVGDSEESKRFGSLIGGFGAACVCFYLLKFALALCVFGGITHEVVPPYKSAILSVISALVWISILWYAIARTNDRSLPPMHKVPVGVIRYFAPARTPRRRKTLRTSLKSLIPDFSFRYLDDGGFHDDERRH